MLDNIGEIPVEMDLAFREFGLWGSIYGVISFISGTVLLITSVTLGCVLAKKHKVLASIGCYYLITLTINSLSTAVGVGSLYESVDQSVDLMYMTSSVLYAVVIVAGSALSIWLMNKKLNLP